MVAAEGENFDDVRVIDRGGDARFLLQLHGVARLGISAQEFQRHKTIQRGVARLVNRAHTADAEGFHDNEIVERALDAKLLLALWTQDARERLNIARIDLRPAIRAVLRLCSDFALGHQAILTSALRRATAARQ